MLDYQVITTGSSITGNYQVITTLQILITGNQSTIDKLDRIQLKVLREILHLKTTFGQMQEARELGTNTVRTNSNQFVYNQAKDRSGNVGIE